jgi:ankyrin repeat protein
MVKYQILPFQAWLLSLAPPTRALDTPFDPVRSKAPVIAWIHEQGPYLTLSKPGGGCRLLHLHADGNPLLDVSSLSRLFYVDYDASCTLAPYYVSGRQPEATVVYFEFDRHDSRYNTIWSLMLYLLNAHIWHFWKGTEPIISEQLAFLGRVHSWSLDDLFHLYSTIRRLGIVERRYTVFISCFDQCPADQRQWFLERVLEQQSYSDAEYRIVLSTSARDDLVVASFPDEARINLNSSPALSASRDNLTAELRSLLSALIARRPVYEDLRPQLESLLDQCQDVPYLGRIILNWLGFHHRGSARSEIADKITRLSPVTEENIVRVFIASLTPVLRTRVETVFNWVKHAAEPWSPEALIEALAVHDSGGGAPSLDDLDVEGTMREIEEALGGIITQKGGDIRFSHASFYRVPEVGFEGGGLEAAAKSNSTIAATCLRYLHLSCAQETLEELSQVHLIPEGVPWATPVDSAVISHPRTSMAAYAVRFWHHHYKASGRFKPRELVDELFASKRARAGWEVSFWLLSNPFTRMQRSYISTLPVFAMLGLEDLVQERLRSERGKPGFEKDCWFAITEAARAGRKPMVQQLLGEVAVDEGELSTALHWAAGRSEPGIVNALLDKIPKLEGFRWPENMMHQAAAAGLDDLLAAMSLSGCDINEINEKYWGAPPAVIVAWRNRVSTMEFLLDSDFKPDLSITDTSAGDTPLTTAADHGHPRMVEVLLQGGASVEAKDEEGQGLATLAAIKCNHKALDILIKAGANFKSGTESGAPLVAAAENGSEECVRLLLAHQANPEAEWAGTTPLYQAVAGNHPGITRLLLAHDPKPDMDKTPEGHLKLLMCAVRTGNPELVSLLIDQGAEVDFVDPNTNALCKTPLSLACAQGNLEMVKLLLANGADINYTGGKSDSPLLTALYQGKVQLARHLLQDATTDVKLAAGDGTTALHVAFQKDFDISELLQRGASVNAHSTSYGTPLHAAARQGNQKAIDRLLANDPKPEIDYVYEDGWRKDEVGLTPLQVACKHHFPKCVKALLKGGANPKLKNKNGDDAVDILLRAESDQNDVADCLRMLLSVPYNVPVDQLDEQGRTRLHGIQEMTPVSIVGLLAEANVPLDVPDQKGHTPLSVAVSKGNEMVARYLTKQGASVNRCGPGFGSILHLAVSRGDLNMAKFLVASGADLETVDPEYDESLLYTALGIADDAKLKAMVRYLVDSVKVPINKPCGAQFSYPIIRAANLARTSYLTGTQILKFLIRRKAQLDVADSQGRRAVHLACASQWDDAVKALVEAGAKIDVKDELGRKPIHFAASVQSDVCFRYLTETFNNTDINDTDHDKWTPLMWAARSGSIDTLRRLVEANVDVWVRGCGADRARDEWSALKLLRFSGRTDGNEGLQLEPKERTQIRPNGKREEWNDAFHKVEAGDLKRAFCDSCLVVSYTPPPPFSPLPKPKPLPISTHGERE